MKVEISYEDLVKMLPHCINVDTLNFWIDIVIDWGKYANERILHLEKENKKLSEEIKKLKGE